jgi:uncharacterized protein
MYFCIKCIKMPFEFDENKSIANKVKHGIDFIEAQKLWYDPERVEIPARNLDESRYMIIGRINKEIWSGIYTIRNKNIRLISVRKAREYEKEIYKGR